MTFVDGCLSGGEGNPIRLGPENAVHGLEIPHVKLMNRLFLSLFAALTCLGLAACRDALPTHTLKPGSVGLLKVEGQTKESVQVLIEFSNDALDPAVDYAKVFEKGKFPPMLPEDYAYIPVPDNLFVFDGKGVVANLHGRIPKFGLHPWCENDGGVHYRPVVRASIPKSDFTRIPKPSRYYDNVAAFVGVGLEAQFRPLKTHFEEIKQSRKAQTDAPFQHLVMEGRLLSGGVVVAGLAEYQSDAGCDGLQRAFCKLNMQLDIWSADVVDHSARRTPQK